MDEIKVLDPKETRLMNLRDAYSSALIELGRENPDVVVLDADLALSTKTKRFGTQFPDRFFDFGIGEANMMGAAAGLATCGKIVFASSFAVFATGRCYDQIRQSIAYPNLPVKIVATHAGISVGGDGASHQMLEDIGLMRVLPNVRVIAPADGTMMKVVIPLIAKERGPFYVRMGRADSPLIFESCEWFKLGEAVTVKEGKDLTLIGTGTLLCEVLKAWQLLKEEGIDARVLLIHTIKPIDKEAIMKASRETGTLVTCEEHSIIGGLGSAVAEVVGEEAPCLLKRIGIRDVFGESGDPQELMIKYEIDASHIAQAAKTLIKGRRK
jgi:transketolase